MNNDLKDILSNSNKDIDNQQLLAYLSNQLSKTNTHEVEKTMADDPFINDAMEGLQQIDNKKNIPIHLAELQASLQKQLAKNAKRNYLLVAFFVQVKQIYTLLLFNIKLPECLLHFGK